MAPKPPFTHFGFDTIGWKEKTEKIKNLFNAVAPAYDLMNDLMSFGLHRCWKETVVQSLPYPQDNQTSFHILDLAAGTGDITDLMLKKYTGLPVEIQWTLADLSMGMIEQGRQKPTLKQHPQVHWVCCNSEAMPFPDNHFDLCTLVFGLRNMTDIDQALQEIYRVLKPGGRLFCLEFSAVQSPVLTGLYDFYAFQVIPKLGKWVANDQKAYQYLVESIRRFPSQALLAHAMEEAAFQNVTFQNFFQGIAACHQGVKHAKP